MNSEKFTCHLQTCDRSGVLSYLACNDITRGYWHIANTYSLKVINIYEISIDLSIRKRAVTREVKWVRRSGRIRQPLQHPPPTFQSTQCLEYTSLPNLTWLKWYKNNDINDSHIQNRCSQWGMRRTAAKCIRCLQLTSSLCCLNQDGSHVWFEVIPATWYETERHLQFHAQIMPSTVMFGLIYEGCTTRYRPMSIINQHRQVDTTYHSSWAL